MPAISTDASDLLDQFKNKIIGHSHLKSAFARVMELIEEPADVEVAAIIGPTGVGKSTLLVRVQQEIMKLNLSSMKANAGLMPVISVIAPVSQKGTFDWREMYLDLLGKLKEPSCDWHLVLKQKGEGKPGAARLESLNPIELKRRMEAALQLRGVKVLLIDEAQHFGKVNSGRRLQDQTDCIKAIAQSTGVFVVLFGTYDLIPLLTLNGQVARRVTSIHLPRYRCDEPKEWADFQTSIRSLESELRLSRSSDLVGKAEVLYKGSVGCVGILKSWLISAYTHALRNGLNALTLEVLQHTRKPTAALRTYIEEILHGENHWAKCHAEDRELDGLLGLKSLKQSQNGAAKNGKPISKTVPVGMRKPTRDPIGVEGALA